MRARLIHRFDYRYSEPVLLGPHRFCLRPRPHGFQRLITYGLQVSPDPSQLYELLAAGGELGKRLDFLIQELHREANTLGSKSAALELTRISVDMKVLIEQMREQVQNIE